MSAVLEARVERLLRRIAVRSWEQRQRRHAKGVWFRLRRALTEAETALLIPVEAAEELVRCGFAPLAVGLELEPPKEIFLIDPEQTTLIERLERLGKPTRVGLTAELLAARRVALIRFG